jgi:small subunit ribosomal protein S20
LAEHKSALKRARQNEAEKIRNMGRKTRIKSVVKEARAAIAGNSRDKAIETLRKAQVIIQKSVSNGAIHKKKASRKISRLTRQANKISKS